MKKSIFLSVALCGAVLTGLTSCGGTTPNAKLNSAVDSVSYAIGVSTGAQFKESLAQTPGEPLNVENVIAGFTMAIQGDSGKINASEAMVIIEKYFSTMSQREAKMNKEAGDKFIAEKSKEDSVIKTESGLLYKVVKAGNGPKPAAENRVKVNYKGTLIDGTEFDSTEKHGGEPAEVVVGRMIPGWVEGLQLMNVGSKYIFYIPSELGYGEQAVSRELKGNSALVFEVELVDIVKESK